MSKVAVLVVNPVNGYGLFNYLEKFYESKVEYDTFVIGTSKEIKTNSGYALTATGTINDLKGNEAKYDGVVFACGDAMMKMGEVLKTQECQDALAVLKTFNELGKPIAGHCVGGNMFDLAGVAKDKKVAVHPFAKSALVNAITTDNTSMIDKNLFTASCEDHINEFLPLFIMMVSMAK